MKEEQYVPGMLGCSDGGCLFAYKHPGTMVTNGGCSCQRELMRSENGMKAVMLINHLRQNWPSMPFAGAADHSWMEERPVPAPNLSKYPQRTMLHKVNMIKEIREKAGCGLKEAKHAMDAVYPDCWDFDQVVTQAVARLTGKQL